MPAPIAITDISFSLAYEATDQVWRAETRELPVPLAVTSATAQDALTALMHHVEDLIAYLNENPTQFGSAITGTDWEYALKAAKITRNGALDAIRAKSLSALRDPVQLERIARHVFHHEHHLPADYMQNDIRFGDAQLTKYDRDCGYFIDGYKRGVKAAIRL